MNYYEIINETNENLSEINELNTLVDFVLGYEKLNNVIFNIIIVNNKRIHDINKEYRNVDRPTDVISFALEDNDTIQLPNRVLGDIYISIDKAREQAISYGHSLKREISFLLVHGILHLLGYDHMNMEDEKVMFDHQEMILNEANIKK